MRNRTERIRPLLGGYVRDLEQARVIIRLEEQLPQTFDAPCTLLVVYQLAFSSF